MPSTERIPRAEAISAAKALVAQLEGTYTQLVVAGSLRRRLAFVHDVEIVAVPKVDTVQIVVPDLFGDRSQDVEIDRLDERLNAMLAAGQIEKRLDSNGVPRWGQTLRYATYQGARVDLFTPCVERFGWILMLRTGPYKFSKQLVVAKGKRTNDGRPGLLPAHIKPSDGWLTYRTSGERIETSSEEAVFDLFKLPYLPPWERV